MPRGSTTTPQLTLFMNFNKLYNGDCLEVLPTIPDGCVDMILCDPPYGATAASWDKHLDWESIWPHYWRILKPNGAVVLFAQMPFAAQLVCSQLKFFRYEWIWGKNMATGFLNSKRAPLKCHESLLVFYKKMPTYNLIKLSNQKAKAYYRDCSNERIQRMEIYNSIRSNHVRFSSDGSRVPRDVISFATVSTEKKGKGTKGMPRTEHPTQKPTTLLRHMIKVYTNPGEVVFDNCMGSGSTCVAAVETGRQYIGIEREKKYYEVACRRVSHACPTVNGNPLLMPHNDDPQLTLF